MTTAKRKRHPGVDDYIAALEEPRANAVSRLRDVLCENLPVGFEEQMGSMPSYVVPLSIYPPGYHTSPNTPLPYISFASQKGFIALHHFGIYVDRGLLAWFTEQYPKHSSTKLDMGKSCIRFKKIDQIPYSLIAELVAKRSVDEWVSSYEKAMGR